MKYVKSSALTPRCLWCRKECKPNYQTRCKDCQHPSFEHRMSSTSPRTCKGDQCPCRNIVRGLFNPDNDRFYKQHQGFGLKNKGLFCTIRCAVEWALHYAEEIR